MSAVAAYPERPRTESRRAENHRAWTAALDRLEQEILLAERLLQANEPATAEAWTPPRMLGPIPMDLVSRAQSIQQRQIALQKELTLALLTNRKHQSLAERAQYAPASSPPAYLDTTA